MPGTRRRDERHLNDDGRKEETDVLDVPAGTADSAAGDLAEHLREQHEEDERLHDGRGDDERVPNRLEEPAAHVHPRVAEEAVARRERLVLARSRVGTHATTSVSDSDFLRFDAFAGDREEHVVERRRPDVEAVNLDARITQFGEILRPVRSNRRRTDRNSGVRLGHDGIVEHVARFGETCRHVHVRRRDIEFEDVAADLVFEFVAGTGQRDFTVLDE